MRTKQEILLKEKNSMEKRQRVEWLDLPTELWTKIAKYLILQDNTSFDVFRFRCICKTWRSAHPLPQHTPFAPQDCIPLRWKGGKSFLLQTIMYRLEPLLHDAPNNTNQFSSKGWLIMLEGRAHKRPCNLSKARREKVYFEKEESESVPLRLLNPFTCTPVSNDSQAQIFSSDDTLPRVLNFMDFKVVKLLEAFNLSSKYYSTNKVVLFPSSFPVEGVCALFKYSDSNLCVRKIGDERWTDIKLSNRNSNYHGFDCYRDIIINKEQLYVIDNLGTIFWMNPLSMELVQFTQPLCSWDNGKTKKMVEFGGKLYVVEMHIIKIKRNSLDLEVDIKAYKVDEESGAWEVVKNLGDAAFVLGKNSNFSLSAQDYHGIEGNCIYFWTETLGRVFCFNLKDSTLTTPGPFWPCPNLFKKT